MKEIDAYIERYNKIQDAINASELYKNAVDSFKIGLKDFTFTPQEQANAYATFLAQTITGLQAQSMEMALKLQVAQVQAEDLRGKSAIETNILKSQALAQAINAQTAQATLEQEKIKCQVLIKSANDNTEINKSNALVQYMNVIGNANNYANLTAGELHTKIRDSIMAIGKDGSLDMKSIEDLEKQKAQKVIIYASKTDISVGEIITFGVISNIADVKTIEWDFGGTTFIGSENMQYRFDTIGYHEVSVRISDGETTHSNNLRVLVR
ncbi:hypothetical protein [Helicobacter sp. 11S02596-1]|uniref:PKD domain-containing protein n=1 Tax=Helicobacter sp. 11S02596-1 TaxID=1476194 RepID=UPI000BA5861D|nr:hypothetical protein [Helicobacter sp. 11S02596-1]PAF41365.1 hypothetical protein BJI48_08725 [Helicobacter sp. 11S02596-1]